MKHLVVWACAVAVLSMAACSKSAIQSNPEAEAAAVAAAKAWLSVLDAQDYAKAWEGTSTLFKTSVPKPAWQYTLSGMREPHGKNLSRELESAKYFTAEGGTAQRQYVQIRFKSSFEGSAAAFEKITATQDDDGQWRMSGYTILLPE